MTHTGRFILCASILLLLASAAHAQEGRKVLLLNGTWEVAEGSMEQVPQRFEHRMPVPGLYLCGAGAHPGGGVTGAPGHNAAQAVIADFARKRTPAFVEDDVARTFN